MSRPTKIRGGSALLMVLALLVSLGGTAAAGTAGGNSVSIDFDDQPQACSFDQMAPLRDEYGSLGVLFYGRGHRNGGGVGDVVCGNWGVTGFSPPNALMFNAAGQYGDGGVPGDPETIQFTSPMTHVQVNVAHGFNAPGHLRMHAFDAGWHLVASADLTLSSVLTTVSTDGEGITYVVLHSSSYAWLLDDLKAS